MNYLSEDEARSLNDEKLLEEYDTARGNLSYYNAAEGDSWYREAEGRAKAGAYRALIFKEVEKRGLTPNPGNFLC